MDAFLTALGASSGEQATHLALVGLVGLVLWLVRRTVASLDELQKEVADMGKDMAVVKDRLGIVQ